jgi:hypothetical protein
LVELYRIALYFLIFILKNLQAMAALGPAPGSSTLKAGKKASGSLSLGAFNKTEYQNPSNLIGGSSDFNDGHTPGSADDRGGIPEALADLSPAGKSGSKPGELSAVSELTRLVEALIVANASNQPKEPTATLKRFTP